METDKIFNSKLARSAFFITFVGGLFLFTAIALENLCNRVLFDIIHFPCITTLESAGIIAFAYIFIFGVRFGIKKSLNEKSNLTSANQPNIPKNCKENIQKMSQNQKHELRYQLSQKFGSNK